jgi:hypothetical protein
MTYPEATVLLRILNGERQLKSTLDSLVAQQYDGPVFVRARIDANTTDGAEDLVARYMRMNARSNWDWEIERTKTHETLWTATRALYEEASDGVIYLLDVGNVFAPGRLRRGWDCDPKVRPVCVNQAVWRVAADVPGRNNRKLLMPQTTKVIPTLEHLFRWGWYDTLCLRIDGRFAREVLAPLMDNTNDELGEDYFTTIIARHLEGLCAHEVYAGDFVVRPGSLNATSHIENPEKDNNMRAYIIERGLNGDIDRLGAAYRETVT